MVITNIYVFNPEIIVLTYYISLSAGSNLGYYSQGSNENEALGIDSK